MRPFFYHEVLVEFCQLDKCFLAAAVVGMKFEGLLTIQPGKRVAVHLTQIFPWRFKKPAGFRHVQANLLRWPIGAMAIHELMQVSRNRGALLDSHIEIKNDVSAQIPL